MTAHAVLGASSAHRWMACPGSVELTKDMPDPGSVYAQEGTTAHELAELCLRGNMDAVDLPDSDEWSAYPQDMREHVQTYIDYVRARVAECGGRLLVEQRVNYSEWVPGGFGTADAIVLTDDRIIVIDLKYGQGVQVEAAGNPQARLYALGAWADNWFDFDGRAFTVESVIVQPRRDHVSCEELTPSELLDFAEQAARAAHAAIQDDAPLVPGEEQCKFCRARATCRARAEHNLAVAADEFGEPLDRPPKLSPQEVAELLPKLPGLLSWAKDVQDYALQYALDGNELAGYKLVRGRSVRRWLPGALEHLAAHELADDLIQRKPVGIGAAEKVLGKKSDLIASYTEKPEGAPVLVPSSDKRAAIQGASTAADDFAD